MNDFENLHVNRYIKKVKNSSEKLIVLTFIGNYLPGYKAGGILRTTINTVDHLHEEFDFKIVTRDRDLGDAKPYYGVRLDEWQKVENAEVYYLSEKSSSIKHISTLIKKTEHHVLYLNSYFDSLTIKVLIIRLFHARGFRKVIVAPWGEFGWASLKQKFVKKIIFIKLARLIGLYKNVVWRASSKYEKQDIIKYLKTKPDEIYIVSDFPIKNNQICESDIGKVDPVKEIRLKIVFLSRIAREKNLDFALEVLSGIQAKVIFDIYGPAENQEYWKECQDIIENLPDNVKVNYLGSVDADKVVSIFSNYDLFLFPTGGEAFGHVIAECLLAGTPVLISTETPWRNMVKDGLGWDLNLQNIEPFKEKIENLATAKLSGFLPNRKSIKEMALERLSDPVVMEENRQLFIKQIHRK